MCKKEEEEEGQTGDVHARGNARGWSVPNVRYTVAVEYRQPVDAIAVSIQAELAGRGTTLLDEACAREGREQGQHEEGEKNRELELHGLIASFLCFFLFYSFVCA